MSFVCEVCQKTFENNREGIMIDGNLYKIYGNQKQDCLVKYFVVLCKKCLMQTLGWNK